MFSIFLYLYQISYFLLPKKTSPSTVNDTNSNDSIVLKYEDQLRGMHECEWAMKEQLKAL